MTKLINAQSKLPSVDKLLQEYSDTLTELGLDSHLSIDELKDMAKRLSKLGYGHQEDCLACIVYCRLADLNKLKEQQSN